MEASGAATPSKGIGRPFQGNNSLQKLGCSALIPHLGYNYLTFFPEEKSLDVVFLGILDTYYQVSNQNDCLNYRWVKMPISLVPFAIFVIR